MVVIAAEDTDGDPPNQAWCDALKKQKGLNEVLLVKDDASKIVINTLKLNPVNHHHFVLGPGMKISYAGKGNDSAALAAVQALIDAL